MTTEIITILPTLENLQPGDHLCCIYETEDEHRAVFTPYLRRGLECGEKVLYIVDAHTAETILGYLRNEGLQMEQFLKSGQFAILTRDDAYMRQGFFDPDAMISLLKAETKQAIAQGYTALRVTGEMTWALRGLPGSERLIEYEIKLNEFLPGSQCLALCQYDRRRFEPEVLIDVLRAHSISVIGTQVYENFYYIPPAELLRRDELPAVELRHWIQNLAERKRIDEELRRERDFAESLIKTAQAIILVLDVQGRIVRFNPYMEEISGYRMEDVQGKDWFSTFLPERDHERIRELFLKAIGDIKTHGNVNPIVTKDGSERQIEWYDNTLRDAHGNIIGLLSIGLDTTDRRRVEEEFKQIKHQIELILQSAGEGILGLDLEGNQTFVNPAAAKMLGYEIEELIGQPSHIMWHHSKPDGSPYPAEKCPIYGAYKDGTIHSRDDEVFWRKDGTSFPVRYTSTPIWEADKLTGAVIVFRDITERKQAQEALRESEERYRLLFEGESDAILVFDGPSRRIIDVNPAALNLYGYSREEFLNMQLKDVAAEPEESEKTFQIALMGKLLKVPLKYHREKDGTVFPVEIAAGAFSLRGQQIVIGAIRDVTEGKQAEEKIRAKIREIERLNKLFIGRENRMIELKKEVNTLLERLGQPKKYEVSFLVGERGETGEGIENREA
jgi:PAS domain S-box-containing protein